MVSVPAPECYTLVLIQRLLADHALEPYWYSLYFHVHGLTKGSYDIAGDYLIRVLNCLSVLIVCFQGGAETIRDELQFQYL